MDARATQAGELMSRFAERTGLDSAAPERRYLWTDAFAVCNFLGLARAAGDTSRLALARRLVERVHHVLGRHRPDDVRRGWIGGASDADGEAHPTAGGLRIGKPLPERGAGEPLDQRLEWDRDGQYFHYLTKWMHALDRLAGATADPDAGRWARELAVVAHRAFTFTPRGGGARRMHWKMSIDLSRPLVPSMGQHAPLDGWITSVQLTTGGGCATTAEAGELQAAASDFASMAGAGTLVTEDPLGLGGLLTDAVRVAQLMARGAFADGRLAAALLAAAHEGLASYARGGEWRLPAAHRLGFRELGLAIGLRGVEWLRERPEGAPLRPALDALARWMPLGDEITTFWATPAHREAASWSAHLDINEVMLATSLAPEGFLVLSRA